MLPTAVDTLHVRSSRVLVDGHPMDATVELSRVDGQLVVADLQVDRPEDVVDLGHHIVAPAPLDLHLHGAGGHVVPPDGEAADVGAALEQAGRQAGWAIAGAAPRIEWLATLPIPQQPPADPVEHLATASAMIAASPAGACAGLRIEGLFLNPARAGVWPPQTFRAPDPGLLEQLHAAARDGGTDLRVIDVAPELDGALAMISRARELGIVVSLAHSDATWAQARRAIDAGATLATHTWNAMRPVAHRDPGIVAAVLADPRVTCELICDGIHLHPGIVALSVAACGRGGWASISDASPFAGCEPGRHDWAGTTVTHDGTALRDAEDRLAGSASLLPDALPVLALAGVCDIDAVLSMGATPRRVLDPDRPLGLVVGDPAWIVEVSTALNAPASVDDDG